MAKELGKALATSIGRRLRETYSEDRALELPKPIADRLAALRDAERRSTGGAGENPPADGDGDVSDDGAAASARDGSSGLADANF